MKLVVLRTVYEKKYALFCVDAVPCTQVAVRRLVKGV